MNILDPVRFDRFWLAYNGFNPWFTKPAKFSTMAIGRPASSSASMLLRLAVSSLVDRKPVDTLRLFSGRWDFYS